MTWVWVALGTLALVAILDRLLLAAEARGWINYRRTPARKGTAARAMLGVQQVLEPDKAHVLEAENFEDDRIEREASGAPPGHRPRA